MVVTGGADGIGRGVCEAWAAAGGKVMCGDIDTTKGAELAEAVGGALHFQSFDASKAEDCEDLIANALAKFGRIDALCNNVGIQADDGNGAHELDLAVWSKVLAVNLTSYFLCAKHTLRHFLERGEGGAIINMASVQGLQSQAGIPAYASSKGAVLSLTRQMAVQYAPEGIRVNAVCPGTISTPLVRNLLEQRGWPIEAAAEPYPMKRIGESSEVAEAVLFLASDARASFVTGQALCVDGGIMAIGSWANAA